MVYRPINFWCYIMSWSDYPYENPNINTYVFPVAIELYQAINERLRVAKYILRYNNSFDYGESDNDVLIRLRGVGSNSSIVRLLWGELKDCLRLFRDPSYSITSTSDDRNFFIYQSWLGIYFNGKGYRVSSDLDFFDHYQSVFGDNLIYLRTFILREYNPKVLSLAGIFKDIKSIINNCLNEVVGFSESEPTLIRANTPNPTTIRLIGDGIRIFRSSDGSGSDVEEAYNDAYSRCSSNDFDSDRKSYYGNNFFPYFNFIQFVRSGGSISSIPVIGASSAVQQVVGGFGHRLVDGEGAFFQYQNFDISTIHYKSVTVDSYSNLNFDYIGDENMVFSSPTVILGGNLVTDYTEINGSNAIDFNLTGSSPSSSVDAGAQLLVAGSYININEQGALKYYTEPNP